MAQHVVTAPTWPVAAAAVIAAAGLCAVPLALAGPEAIRLVAAIAGYAAGLLFGVLLWVVERTREDRRRTEPTYRLRPARGTAIRWLLASGMLTGLACAVLAALEIAKR